VAALAFHVDKYCHDHPFAPFAGTEPALIDDLNAGSWMLQNSLHPTQLVPILGWLVRSLPQLLGVLAQRCKPDLSACDRQMF